MSELLEHPFIDDNPATVYKELKDGEKLIRDAAAGLFTLVEDVERKHDIYEGLKNELLRQMYQEEADKTIPKRTELQRQIAYRLKHRAERLAWQLAKRDAEAQKEYLGALESIQTSIEARAKLISLDERFAGRNYGP
jgi:hypothetical protein